MNIAFALDYIPRRMKELGYGENYLTRYRHVRVEDKSSITINAYNQLLLFISPEGLNINIKSSRGIYNLSDYTINEQQHEHSGAVAISNNTGQDQYMVFVQVIPKNKTKNLKK